MKCDHNPSNKPTTAKIDGHTTHTHTQNTRRIIYRYLINWKVELGSSGAHRRRLLIRFIACHLNCIARSNWNITAMAPFFFFCHSVLMLDGSGILDDGLFQFCFLLLSFLSLSQSLYLSSFHFLSHSIYPITRTLLDSHSLSLSFYLYTIVDRWTLLISVINAIFSISKHFFLRFDSYEVRCDLLPFFSLFNCQSSIVFTLQSSFSDRFFWDTATFFAWSHSLRMNWIPIFAFPLCENSKKSWKDEVFFFFNETKKNCTIFSEWSRCKKKVLWFELGVIICSLFCWITFIVTKKIKWCGNRRSIC